MASPEMQAAALLLWSAPSLELVQNVLSLNLGLSWRCCFIYKIHIHFPLILDLGSMLLLSFCCQV